MDKKLYSYHTFIFPFSIEAKKEGEKVEIEEIIKKIKTDLNWNYEAFDRKGGNLLEISPSGKKIEIPNYNEWKYFYKPVQNILYNSNSKDSSTSEISYYFSYEDVKIENDNQYCIKFKSSKESIEEYKLKLVGLSIRIFETGVGILTFNAENRDYNELKDIKQINEFGRRIYPQIYPVKDAKKLFLAEELKIKITDSKEIIENFEDFEGGNLKISKTITDLLNDNFNSKYELIPLIDDRMFTICWYGNTQLSNELKKYKDEEYEYINNDKWASFLFVDSGSSSCENKVMTKKLLKKHTYSRWVNFGTLYGISRYSFMALSNDEKDLELHKVGYIINHMRTMYYQLITLCLVQRASILNFKNRITKILSNQDVKYIEIESLQKDYLKFINSMCFKEITAQEQGIELYNMAKDIMGIDEALESLNNDIEKLNNYYSLKEGEKAAKNSENLATLAGIFLIPTLILTILNSDLLKGHPWFDSIDKYIGFGIILPLFITFILLKKWFKKFLVIFIMLKKWFKKFLITFIMLKKWFKKNLNSIDNITVLTILLLIYVIAIA